MASEIKRFVCRVSAFGTFMNHTELFLFPTILITYIFLNQNFTHQFLICINELASH